jgi:hypothetical protein
MPFALPPPPVLLVEVSPRWRVEEVIVAPGTHRFGRRGPTRSRPTGSADDQPAVLSLQLDFFWQLRLLQ